MNDKILETIRMIRNAQFEHAQRPSAVTERKLLYYRSALESLIGRQY